MKPMLRSGTDCKAAMKRAGPASGDRDKNKPIMSKMSSCKDLKAGSPWARHKRTTTTTTMLKMIND
ncbi:hypothetical protein H6P81_019625 [Aristolochia fimbriata]|uniref:Uncharacterized protein n=1 Tax=Aristolochia fimbriata TaxID=158543 RepID=A0AAV7DS61_ARIFI|nr:hypothetical protein H6P81_019625 [Aristolochia fimbriata]